MGLCYLFSAKTAWQLVNRKAHFYKTNRFESIRMTNRMESIRIANWNALIDSLLYKKLSYRRGTARRVVSVEILPIATQQYSY